MPLWGDVIAGAPVEPSAEQMDQPLVACFAKLPSVADLTGTRPRKLRLAADEHAATAEGTAAGASESADGADYGSAAAVAAGDGTGGDSTGGDLLRPPAEARASLAGLLVSAHGVLGGSLARDHRQLKKLAKRFLADEATTGALTEKQAARLDEARKAQVQPKKA